MIKMYSGSTKNGEKIFNLMTYKYLKYYDFFIFINYRIIE